MATITDCNIQVVKRLQILSLQSHDFMKSRCLSDLKNQQVVGVERKIYLTYTVDEVAESVSICTATFITATREQVTIEERKRDHTCAIDEVAESVSICTATFITATREQVTIEERKRDHTCAIDEVAESVSICTATFITAGDVDALL